MHVWTICLTMFALSVISEPLGGSGTFSMDLTNTYCIITASKPTFRNYVFQPN